MAGTLRTERGLDRLVNFSDATVAIAITLLMLPLVDVAAEIGDHPLGDLLADNWGTILAFLVSFGVIARFWVSHHKLFEAVRSYSDTLMRVNFLWLVSVVFLPFSSNLIAHAYADRAVNALYIGTMATTSLALTLMGEIVLRDGDLRAPDGERQLHPIDARLTFATMVTVLVLAVLFPHIGLFWLLLLVPAGWLSAVLERRATAR